MLSWKKVSVLIYIFSETNNHFNLKISIIHNFLYFHIIAGTICPMSCITLSTKIHLYNELSSSKLLFLFDFSK